MLIVERLWVGPSTYLVRRLHRLLSIPTTEVVTRQSALGVQRRGVRLKDAGNLWVCIAESCQSRVLPEIQLEQAKPANKCFPLGVSMVHWIIEPSAAGLGCRWSISE